MSNSGIRYLLTDSTKFRLLSDHVPGHVDGSEAFILEITVHAVLDLANESLVESIGQASRGIG